MNYDLRLSPIEQKLYDVMADGEPHKKPELLTLIDEAGASDGALHAHIYKLNLKLRIAGEVVIAQSFGRGVGYRRMRPIETANKPTMPFLTEATA